MAAETRPTIEELLERNKQYAAAHQPIPSLMTRMKNDPKAHGPHVVVVSCLDSRANPLDFLELAVRECLIIRNVGGRIASSATDIAALDSVFHIAQIIMVHHSNCGTSHVTRQQALDSVRDKRPDFTGWGDLEARLPMKEDNFQSVVEDLEKVKTYGFLRKDLIDGMAGFWLDVETGLLTRVYADGRTSKM